MGMLELANDEPAVIRRRRRAGPVRIDKAAATPTSRGPQRLSVTTVAVWPRLSGCI